MHHTLAWFENIAQAAENDLAPVVDGIWTIQNNHFLPQRNYFIQYVAGLSADAQRLRIITPKFRQITTPFIRPLEGNLVPGNDPNVADYRANPLVIAGLEELQLNALQDGVGAEDFTALMGVSEGPLTPMSQGDIYTLLGTSTTAATADVWSQIAMTWQDTLPQGVFAVVGGQHISTNGMGFRLIFEDQVMRPGGLSSSDEENRAASLFRMGGLGIWGRFNSNRMPNVEVLADGADAVHTVYLDIMRVG